MVLISFVYGDVIVPDQNLRRFRQYELIYLRSDTTISFIRKETFLVYVNYLSSCEGASGCFVSWRIFQFCLLSFSKQLLMMTTVCYLRWRCFMISVFYFAHRTSLRNSYLPWFISNPDQSWDRNVLLTINAMWYCVRTYFRHCTLLGILQFCQPLVDLRIDWQPYARTFPQLASLSARNSNLPCKELHQNVTFAIWSKMGGVSSISLVVVYDELHLK